MVKKMAFRRREYELFYYALAETSLGWVGIIGNEKGLREMFLPENSKEDILNYITKNDRSGIQFVADNNKFSLLLEKVRNYFNGEHVHFNDQEINLSGYTPFQKIVLLKTREIPYGATRTYRWLAEQAGYPRAYRAAGGVMRINPLPLIIPCHRVLGSQGQLTGFSATGGLALKHKMLSLEGALKNNKDQLDE